LLVYLNLLGVKLMAKKKQDRLERKTPDIIDAYIKYQFNTEPGLAYQRWVGVSLLAACMQRKCRLELGTLCFYPNMYIILVGPPGKARKGTAMGPAKKHLASLQVTVAAEATTREALIRRINEAVNTFNDTTEVGHMNMQVHSSLTVFSDELTSFLGYNNKELMSNLADWFDCADKWIYDTKGSGTDAIDNLWLNILGATTPDLMQATMPMELMGGGLASRMLFIYAEQKGKKVPYPMLSKEEEQLRKDVEHDLESLIQMQGKFLCDDDFLDVYQEYYLNKPESTPLKSRHLAYYWERREVHILKLSMIMSASRSNEMIIRACDFHKALEWLEDAEKFMPCAFDGMGHRKDAPVVALVRTLATHGEIRFNALSEMLMADINPTDLKEMIIQLSKQGHIKVDKNAGLDWIIKAVNPAKDGGAK